MSGALTALLLLALIGWVAARQIRSPAQVAADTAAPKPAPITVPVVRQTLSADVIVRGTVRFGAPQAVVLGSSAVKQGASDIVTRSPRTRAQLNAGQLALAVDERPVFVLQGTIPMHRDLRPGDRGPDVRQLKQALARQNLYHGPINDTYDAAGEAAVSGFYLRHGWDPFGPTQAQLDQLRTAQASAAQARDAHLQALNAIDQARRTPTRAEVTQARIDAVTARDALNTATLGLVTAQSKLAAARTAAAAAARGVPLAVANAQRDVTAADADVAAKRAALNAAVNDQQIARTKFNEIPPDAPASEREAGAAAVRQSDDAVARAQADLSASSAAANAARISATSAEQRARDDAAQAARDVTTAAAELRRAGQAIQTARAQVQLSALRVTVLSRPQDTRTLQAIGASTATEAARTQAEVTRLAAQSGIQLPANEILFFQTLPVRVDSVVATRGSTASGTVMNVTSSRRVVDSSLSISDKELVRPGDPVTIEDQDLGIKASGKVGQVADTPGTNRVDPSRFYLNILPGAGPALHAGSSVKLTIAVRSTSGAVLAVPPSALSLGGDGNSRLQISRAGRVETVTVVPGLAAQGLVEVRPIGNAKLAPGDLVIVGSSRGAPASAPLGA